MRVYRVHAFCARVDVQCVSALWCSDSEDHVLLSVALHASLVLFDVVALKKRKKTTLTPSHALFECLKQHFYLHRFHPRSSPCRVAAKYDRVVCPYLSS